MTDPTQQQVATWNKWRKRWNSKIRPLTIRMVASGEYCARLQVFLNSLNFPAKVWDDEKTTDIKTLIDVYNRIESTVSKVDLQQYGLKFYEHDFDILAPPDYPGDEYEADKVETFGFLFILIGMGMIVLGGALKISEHLERRETARINEQKLAVAKVVKDAGGSAPEIKAAIDDFNTENKRLIDAAGLLDTVFGGGSGTMIAAAVGIAVLVFAYAKGRK